MDGWRRMGLDDAFLIKQALPFGARFSMKDFVYYVIYIYPREGIALPWCLWIGYMRDNAKKKKGEETSRATRALLDCCHWHGVPIVLFYATGVVRLSGCRVISPLRRCHVIPPPVRHSSYSLHRSPPFLLLVIVSALLLLLISHLLLPLLLFLIPPRLFLILPLLRVVSPCRHRFPPSLHSSHRLDPPPHVSRHSSSPASHPSCVSRPSSSRVVSPFFMWFSLSFPPLRHRRHIRSPIVTSPSLSSWTCLYWHCVSESSGRRSIVAVMMQSAGAV